MIAAVKLVVSLPQTEKMNPTTVFVVEQINFLTRQLTKKQEAQLLALSKELSSFACDAEKISIDEFSKVFKSVQEKADPIVFCLLRAMMLNMAGQHTKAAGVLLSASPNS